MIEIKVGCVYYDKIFGSYIEINKIEGGFVYYHVSKRDSTCFPPKFYESDEVNLYNEVAEELSDDYVLIGRAY